MGDREAGGGRVMEGRHGNHHQADIESKESCWIGNRQLGSKVTDKACAWERVRESRSIYS